MGSLPPDLIAEILRRLPPKNLLICRCVSKPWCSLIDGPDFIDAHLNYSQETSSNLTILIKNSHLYSVSFDSLVNPVELDYPLMCYNQGIKILGHCNGLLCISNVLDDLAVWNPVIRRHHVLPFLPLELNRYFGACTCSVYVYGFGYDAMNDDYKVVRIAQFKGVGRQSFESEVKVYSLRRKSWRRIGDCPYCVYYPGSSGVCANGALHWMVGRSPDSIGADVIVAVDLGAEEHREVPQPEYGDVKSFERDVGVLKGSLCYIASFGGERVDVWVMKEYGVKESWTKLFSVSQNEVIGFLRYIKPLAYSKTGDGILIEHDGARLFWYDLRGKLTSNVLNHGLPITSEAHICVESLVPVDFKGRPPRRIKRRAEEDDKKKRDDFLSEGFKLVL